LLQIFFKIFIIFQIFTLAASQGYGFFGYQNQNRFPNRFNQGFNNNRFSQQGNRFPFNNPLLNFYGYSPNNNFGGNNGGIFGGSNGNGLFGGGRFSDRLDYFGFCNMRPGFNSGGNFGGNNLPIPSYPEYGFGNYDVVTAPNYNYYG
jgi:hypothetical protein